MIDPGTSVFGLSASQISRRTKAVAKMAGEGVSAQAAPGLDSPGPERR